MKALCNFIAVEDREIVSEDLDYQLSDEGKIFYNHALVYLPWAITEMERQQKRIEELVAMNEDLRCWPDPEED
jgi:hypothetical protein